jgi:hypothetical protein
METCAICDKKTEKKYKFICEKCLEKVNENVILKLYPKNMKDKENIGVIHENLKY